MMEELRQVRAEEFFAHAGYEATPVYSHRLVSRRMHNFYNSNGQQIERLMREYSYNPAFMNPEDLSSLGLAPAVVDHMFDIIRAIHAEGVAILLVEQNVARALEIARRAYVLEEGRIVAEGPAAALRDDSRIRRAYLGLS